MTKSLYAYFGLLNLHKIDSPGHSFYQLGLLDSIRNEFYNSPLAAGYVPIDVQFEFFSYYPPELINQEILDPENILPNTELGKVFSDYEDSLIYAKIFDLDTIITSIKNKSYDKLFLKARFRNLSTLSKKWNDTTIFEEILNTAISSGYTKDQIIILDTDLSLPQSFLDEYSDKLTIIIPSIDIPGISVEFLTKCIEVNRLSKKVNSSIFYGNIDTSDYNAGNSKSEILVPALSWLNNYYTEFAYDGRLILINKKDTSNIFEGSIFVPRNNRKYIWDILSESTIMINITKDKYSKEHFIPARVYEAMIFGMIPVSYNFEFLCKAFSFSKISELSEIIKYLHNCSPEDYNVAYLYFIKSYLSIFQNKRILLNK